MNWTAFAGIAQFLSAVATFGAIVVALFEITKQYKTRLDIMLVPHFPEKHGEFYEMYFDVRITNLSSHPVFLEEGSVFSDSKNNKIRYKLNLPDKELNPGARIYIPFNGRNVYDNKQVKRPNIYCEVITTDQRCFKIKYPYTVTWHSMFDSMEQKNSLIDGYLKAKEERDFATKAKLHAVYDAYNESVDGNFFEKATKKQRLLYGARLKFYHFFQAIKKRKILGIVLICCIEGLLLFFAIWGIVYFF